MPVFQSSSDSADSAKDSARDTADQTKRAAKDGKEDVKQWGRGVKDSAVDSWEQTKRWGQDTSRNAEGSFDANFRETRNTIVDLGHPLINRVFDGFVKVGGVGALHAASQDGYRLLMSEDANKKSFETSAQRVGKEAVQWGLVAGVYTGVAYGIEEVRGVHDWKNAFLGGIVTGAALSLTENNPGGDRVFRGALTGGAIAAAAEFLRNIT